MRTIHLATIALLSLTAGCGGSAPEHGGSAGQSSTTSTGSGGSTGSGSTTSTGGSTGAGGSTGSGGSTGTGGSTGSTTATGSDGGTTTATGPVAVPKTSSAKVYVHMMPWFETSASSGNGKWGQHWTMANQNPDVIDGSGHRQIASYDYPLIGPYASGDPKVIEYQLLLMKYAGVDGVLIDWPGTIQAWDYPKNLQNAEAIMALTAKVGLDFAVVYEDNNVTLAGSGGFVSDPIAAGKADVAYAENHYFGQSNYIHVDGAPLLLDFGPQTFTTSSQWDQIFAPLSVQPTFVTLWYDSNDAGSHAKGEFAWIYSDFTTGLQNFYQNHPLPLKLGVAYPGFNTFYAAGGWGGPAWTLPYNGTDTFAQTLALALGSGAGYVQCATWNDYGEGTMIEPTVQFGYGFLTTLQQQLGVSFGQSELEVINTLYNERVMYAGDAAKQAQLDQVFTDLVSLQVTAAQGLL